MTLSDLSALLACILGVGGVLGFVAGLAVGHRIGARRPTVARERLAAVRRFDAAGPCTCNHPASLRPLSGEPWTADELLRREA